MKLEELDIIGILHLGAVGLGFLLALLAFHLLKKEQSLTHPREGMLKAVRSFMTFSLILTLIGLGAEGMQLTWKHKEETGIPTSGNALDFSKTLWQTNVVTVTNTASDVDQQALNAAIMFLSKLDEGDYTNAYAMTSPFWKNICDYTNFETWMKSVRGQMGKVDSRDLFAWNPISVPTMSGRIGGVQMTFLTQRTGSVLEYSEQVQLVHNLTANVYEIDSFHVFIINELVDTNEIKN